MFHYLFTCVRLLGMYFEQAGTPAYVCLLLLATALSVASFHSFPFGFNILLVTILYFPWKARVRTEEATSRIPAVTLPRNQAVTTLYFPGLGNDGTQMNRYIDTSGFPGALGLLINPVYIDSYDSYNLTRFNVAQSGDVNYALAQVVTLMKERPHDRFIFFGTSRGSAVALKVANMLDEEHIARVAFTVCEGLFDSAPAIIQSRFHPLLARFLTWVLPLVTDYDPQHTATPLLTAANFKHRDHPILLVTSLQDVVIPPEHTMRVFDQLRGTAPNTGLLTLTESPHSSYATWKDVDRLKYREKVQEWVNRYV